MRHMRQYDKRRNASMQPEHGATCPINSRLLPKMCGNFELSWAVSSLSLTTVFFTIIALISSVVSLSYIFNTM